MSRWTLALALFGASLLPLVVRGQGPGSDGGTLRQPWDAPPRPTALPTSLQPLLGATPTTPATPAATTSEQRYPADYNHDIEVTPELGPWLVSVTAYVGPEAPRQARQMVNELRSKYRLPAYVFNFGSEQRQKEQARIRARVEKQRELLEKTRQQFGDGAISTMRINVPTIRIQENCAVLVGGYKDDDQAHRVAGEIRKLDPTKLDPTLLEHKYFGQQNPTSMRIETVKDRNGREIGGECPLVNPFQRAFVARNPTTKRETPVTKDAGEIEALRRLNAEEPFSVLRSPKAYTLAIKQFQTPYSVQDRNEAKAGAGILGMGKGSSTDAAAENAHNLAEVLRKGKLEAYVLHTRYASVVTIGSFDSLDDPNLRSMQHLLETRLQLAAIQVAPPYLPMQIPR